MKLTKRQQIIDQAAERFRKQYCRKGLWETYPDWSPQENYKELKALRSHPKREQVDKIIGNDSWTRLDCYFCEQDVPQAVDLEYSGSIIYICGSCLDFAKKLLKAK